MQSPFKWIPGHQGLFIAPMSLFVSVCPRQPCYQKARQWLLDNIPSVLVFGVCIGVVQVIVFNNHSHIYYTAQR